MADTKISDLTELAFPDLTLADVLPIVNSGITKKIPLNTLFEASSSSYVPYVNGLVGPFITTVGASYLFWNSTYTAVNALSSFWTNHNIGTDNAVLGRNSLLNLTTGYKNVAAGVNALSSVTTGSGNVAIGYQALASNTTGSGNTGIGYNAGYFNVVGNNNTYIGNQSAPNCPDESNTVNLGNAAIKTLRCQAGTITSLSDERDKTDISPLPTALAFVADLNPVSFVWNSRDGSKKDIKDTGFIAQQLLESQIKTNFSIPGLIDNSNPNKLEASYAKLIPVLVKAIQELTEEVAKLKKNNC